MFNKCISLKDISPLKTWDVSNGLNFRCMFKKCISLKKADGIKLCRIRNDADTSDMFQNNFEKSLKYYIIDKVEKTKNII